MADVAENLIAFLLTDATVNAAVGGNRICQTHVPQEFEPPLIWFQRTGETMNDCLDAAPGDDPHEVMFDLECVAATEGAELSLAEAVKDKLHGFRGAFGSQQVQAVFCEDHQDDYEPRSIDSDSGLFVAAMQIMIAPTS